MKSSRSVAKAVTEVKMARVDRKYITEKSARRSHQRAVKTFNRAVRREGKTLCKGWL